MVRNALEQSKDSEFNELYLLRAMRGNTASAEMLRLPDDGGSSVESDRRQVLSYASPSIEDQSQDGARKKIP